MRREKAPFITCASQRTKACSIRLCSSPTSHPWSSDKTVDGTAVKLTSLEYRLLSYLMHHQGRVISRTELIEHLYDQDFDKDSNTVEVFVGRLRKKLCSCS